MKKEVITDNDKSAHLLSQGVVSNGFVFVSGQVHANAELKLVGETVAEKVEQIMQNIQSVLSAAGAGLDDIVKALPLGASIEISVIAAKS